MIGELDTNLKQEYYLECYYKILASHKIFSFNFSDDFLRELSMKVRERRICRENLFEEG
jgi:hypothetical protein